MAVHQEILAPAYTATEQRLAGIWRRALELEHIGREDDFFQLGGDSLAAAQVMFEIERTFGRKLPLTVLQEAPTLKALTAHLERQRTPAPWSCVVALQPLGSNPPFFCVHGAGGSVLGLTDLARHSAPEQPFYGIHACDDEGYDQHFSRIEDMAAHYLEAIRACQPTGPYYLGGYSFGGSVALEMAQQLRARGDSVALLAILDHTPPPTRYRRLVWSFTLPLDLVVNTAQWVVEDIWHAGRGGRWAAVKSRVRAAGSQLFNLLKRSGTGRSDVREIFAGRPLPEAFQRLLETHYQALRDYRPRVYPGRVTLFRARVRPLLRMHGRDLGWSRLAAGGLEIVKVPGNHVTMLKPPHVRHLAEALLAHIGKARSRS
jgi:thioesterase domain-containing protein/acyl carrier protein